MGNLLDIVSAQTKAYLTKNDPELLSELASAGVGDAHGSRIGMVDEPSQLLEARQQSDTERAAEMVAPLGPVDARAA